MIWMSTRANLILSTFCPPAHPPWMLAQSPYMMASRCASANPKPKGVVNIIIRGHRHRNPAYGCQCYRTHQLAPHSGLPLHIACPCLIHCRHLTGTAISDQMAQRPHTHQHKFSGVLVSQKPRLIYHEDWIASPFMTNLTARKTTLRATWYILAKYA